MLFEISTTNTYFHDFPGSPHATLRLLVIHYGRDLRGRAVGWHCREGYKSPAIDNLSH